MRSFSLAYLTAPSGAPPKILRLAAELGYDYVGLRITPSAPGAPFWPLLEDAGLRAETFAALKDSGVGVFDVEILRIDENFRVEDWTGFLELSAALGARAILVAADDRDFSRLVENFGALCAAAQKFGLSANLEFMPWTAAPDARSALRVVEACGADNARILVDALHFARSATTLDEIAAIPPQFFAYAQFCDAPAQAPKTVEGLISAARGDRLLPGVGAIDLRGLLASLPENLPLSLEIPCRDFAAQGGEAVWARRALAAARAICGENF